MPPSIQQASAYGEPFRPRPHFAAKEKFHSVSSPGNGWWLGRGGRKGKKKGKLRSVSNFITHVAMICFPSEAALSDGSCSENRFSHPFSPTSSRYHGEKGEMMKGLISKAGSEGCGKSAGEGRGFDQFYVDFGSLHRREKMAREGEGVSGMID